MTLRIFISGVQKEFAAERAALRDYLHGDALLRRFFEPFLFEEIPAADRRADELYLDGVEHCDVYVGLFGSEYGFEDAQGISPTQREFELATRRNKYRLIAVDFVMSKINLRVGTRAAGPQAPVAYEIPREVVAEAIVNAVAHRDYTSKGSVQVMLFEDRLEVWNPGTLPPSLTLEKLRHPHGSVPANPLLAEALYLAKYIERMGTGTGDMIDRCRSAGLAEPQFALTDGFSITLRRSPERGLVTGQVTGQVTEEVRRVIFVVEGEKSRKQIQETLLLKGRSNFEERYLKPALEAGVIEPTLPDKPKSRLQRYRLTAKGAAILARLQDELNS